MTTTKLEKAVSPELIVLCQIIKTIDQMAEEHEKNSSKKGAIYFSKLRKLLKYVIRDQDLSNAMDILYDHEIITCDWESIDEGGWIRWVRAIGINKEAEHKSRGIYKQMASELPLK